ncbi:MAG: hypothetical protein ACRDDY_08065 [Clostridium sp.]|uniref:hypothetical protein n=1 Tax=Clostridium sp. TaxID=1506 RepID=UPI003EE43902
MEFEVIENKKMIGFIDEIGSYGFDFEQETVSSHFILSCIVVEEEKRNDMEEKIKKIREKYFLTDEMKLFEIEGDRKKRLSVLNELVDLDFKVFTLIIDKEKICEENGLRYRNSFIKFLNGALYSEITNYYNQIELYAEELEGKEFLQEFRLYLLENYVPNLFGEYDVFINEEKSNELTGLSSFIGEILESGFERNKCSIDYKEFYEIIGEKILPISLLPKEADNYIKNLKRYIRVQYDEKIAYKSISLVLQFIKDNENSLETDTKMQVLVLKYLLNVLLNYGENRYIRSEEIKDNLLEITGKDYSSNYFQTKIIAQLRDYGILIATSKKGYKIPIRKKEIMSFVKQSSSVIRPMLKRVSICREEILKATDNDIDILDSEEYKYLANIIKELY